MNKVIEELIEKYSKDGVEIKGIPGSIFSPLFTGWYVEFSVPHTGRRRAVKITSADTAEQVFIKQLSEL